MVKPGGSRRWRSEEVRRQVRERMVSVVGLRPVIWVWGRSGGGMVSLVGWVGKR